MKKHLVSLLVLFLMISTSLVGVSNQMTDDTSQKESFDAYLPHSYLARYNPTETIQDDIEPVYQNQISTISDTSDEHGMLNLDGGLMNSSWPMYCHDTRHTGRSPFSTNNNSGLIKWSFLLYGMGMYGTACINSENIIYIPDINRLYAINPNGTLRWQIIINGWGESCPALDYNGTIYFGTSHGEPSYFYAINPDGTFKWRYSLGGGVYVKSSPVIGQDGTIYFGCEKNIFALYSNGTLRWKYSTNGSVYSSPTIDDDGIVYCGCHDTYLYALYPNNGTLKWKLKTGYWIRTSPCIGADKTIYCVSLDGYLYAVYLNNGTVKWKTDVYAGTSPTIGLDGTIYAGWDALHAVNPVDGSIKWEFPATYIEGGTPCTSSDGTIFFGTTHGELIALNANGTLIWRIQIGDSTQSYGGCDSAPVIGDDGTIYVGSVDYDGFGHMNAIGPGEPKKVEILKPKKGKLNIFGFALCPGFYGQTFLIGTTPIKLKVYQENELLNVTFKITTQDYHRYYYVDTEPPFEWTMNKRFSEKIRESLILTIIGYYKGQYIWSESIPVQYYHFLK